MKNAIQFCTLATALCITLQANAQQNAFKLEGLSILTGNITLSYERAVAPGFTLVGEYQRRQFQYSEGELASIVFFPIASSSTSFEVQGYRMNLSCRYYPKQKMKGFYTENGFFWGRYDVKEETTTTVLILQTETTTNNIGATKVSGFRSGIGIQLHADFVTLDFGAGINFTKSNKDTDHIRGLKPVSPYARAAFGINF